MTNRARRAAPPRSEEEEASTSWTEDVDRRPDAYLDAGRWTVLESIVVTSFGVPSEVLVAAKRVV